MNTSKYVSFKERSAKPNGRQTCIKCLRPTKACFCGLLKPFSTQTKFVLLMHPLEAKPSQIGTGRLTQLGLENSQVIVDSTFNENPRFNKLLNDTNYQQLVLYPGKEAMELTELSSAHQENLKAKPLMIFIIDGTWPCAKSMMRDTTKLHNLPKICFKQNYTSNFAIKHQPADYCLSTIETTFHLLTHLENLEIEKIEADKKESLLKAFNAMVNFHKLLAEDPSNNNYHRTSTPVKNKTARIPSKKWEKRSICFNL